MWSRNPNRSELDENLKLLKEEGVIIGYHGTTADRAKKILVGGFKLPNVRDTLKEAYEITGIGWLTRKKLPSWARKFIGMEIKARVFEKYSHISCGPHGVASQWAGKSGEVLHEVVKNINVIKAFWNTNYPKTEDNFEKWYDAEPSSRRYYQELGEPIVLKAYLKLSEDRTNHWIRYINNLLKWEQEEGNRSDAWRSWNYQFKEFFIRDPKNIMHVEIAEPPKLEP